MIDSRYVYVLYDSTDQGSMYTLAFLHISWRMAILNLQHGHNCYDKRSHHQNQPKIKAGICSDSFPPHILYIFILRACYITSAGLVRAQAGEWKKHDKEMSYITDLARYSEQVMGPVYN